MRIALNPYHLTTRELPALAGLLLAEHAVTILPAPEQGGSRDAFVTAARSLEHYREFVESWAWSRAFWDEGVLTPAHTLATAAGDLAYQGTDALDDVRDACRQIDEDPAYASLRALMRDGMFTSDARSLELIARDVLRGGPDPAVCIPLAEGLDRFARRHDYVVARATPTSIAQRRELDLVNDVARVAIPMLTQASAELLLDLRDDLGDELTQLRAALNDAMHQGVLDPDRPVDDTDLHAAAADYSAAFEAIRSSVIGVDNEDIRPVVREVRIRAALLPAGAVLRSSTDAIGILGRRTPQRTTSHAVSHGSSSGSDAASSALVAAPGHSGGWCRTLIFRVIG